MRFNFKSHRQAPIRCGQLSSVSVLTNVARLAASEGWIPTATGPGIERTARARKPFQH